MDFRRQAGWVAGLVLVLGCASSPPAQVKPTEPEAPPPRAQPTVDGALHCPPPPPPPTSVAPRCGNGVAENVYERIVAPCIPGRCCSEGWVPSAASEECDGADLRGQSCRSLGFVAGTLACTAGCKLDRSRCSLAAQAGARVIPVPGGPQCGSGHVPGLAARGSVLGVAYPNGTTVAFMGFDLRSGQRSGGGSLTLGGGYDQSALAEYYSPHGPRTTTGTVLMTPFADGFLAAVQRYGDDTSTAVVRIRGDGKIEGPTATVRGRPLFIVGSKDGALVGFEGARLELQRLGPDGKAVGQPLSPFGPESAVKFYGQLAASAVASGGGWLVAMGGHEQPLPIEVVSVSSSGIASPVRRWSPAGTEVLLSNGAPSEVVFLQPDGVYAAEALTGAGLRRIASGRVFQVLAATSGPEALSVWVESKIAPTGAGTVSRIVSSRSGPTRSEDVASVPLSRPCAAALDDGTLAVWFGDENRRTSPTLFVGR